MSDTDTPNPATESQLTLMAESLDIDPGAVQASPQAETIFTDPNNDGDEPRKSRNRGKKSSTGDDDLKDNKLKLQLSKLQTDLKAVKKLNEKHRKELTELNVKCTNLTVEKKTARK